MNGNPVAGPVALIAQKSRASPLLFDLPNLPALSLPKCRTIKGGFKSRDIKLYLEIKLLRLKKIPHQIP